MVHTADGTASSGAAGAAGACAVLVPVVDVVLTACQHLERETDIFHLKEMVSKSGRAST